MIIFPGLTDTATPTWNALQDTRRLLHHAVRSAPVEELPSGSVYRGLDSLCTPR